MIFNSRFKQKLFKPKKIWDRKINWWLGILDCCNNVKGLQVEPKQDCKVFQFSFIDVQEQQWDEFLLTSTDSRCFWSLHGCYKCRAGSLSGFGITGIISPFTSEERLRFNTQHKTDKRLSDPPCRIYKCTSNGSLQANLPAFSNVKCQQTSFLLLIWHHKVYQLQKLMQWFLLYESKRNDANSTNKQPKGEYFCFFFPKLNIF